MASSHLVSKTIQLHEKKDPIRNLWRNVLIVAIEDVLKKKEMFIQSNRNPISKEEIWFYHEDFRLICEYAQLEPSMVKKRVFETVERMRSKYGNKDMPKMPGKWLYKSKEISRGSNRNSRTVSTL